jgi:hypothetical protein
VYGHEVIAREGSLISVSVVSRPYVFGFSEFGSIVYAGHIRFSVSLSY